MWRAPAGSSRGGTVEIAHLRFVSAVPPGRIPRRRPTRRWNAGLWSVVPTGLVCRRFAGWSCVKWVRFSGRPGCAVTRSSTESA